MSETNNGLTSQNIPFAFFRMVNTTVAVTIIFGCSSSARNARENEFRHEFRNDRHFCRSQTFRITFYSTSIRTWRALCQASFRFIRNELRTHFAAEIKFQTQIIPFQINFSMRSEYIAGVFQCLFEADHFYLAMLLYSCAYVPYKIWHFEAHAFYFYLAQQHSQLWH